MQANPRTLDTLFSSQLRFVVPMFQRHYVWEEDPQWNTLWEDLVEKGALQIAKTDSNAHYLGALIIEGVKPHSPREVKRFLVIDGQQRLTTLQLIFCAFRDLARLNGWTSLDRTTSRYLENPDADVMENPDEERYKVWPTVLNRDVFCTIVGAGNRRAIEERYPLIKLPRRKRAERRPRLVEAYLYFSDRIERWLIESAEQHSVPAEDCAFALLQALQQDFCVVEIALSDGDDSQEIFYSLNSQGRPLSQSDLLRSLLFMRAEKEKVDRDALFAEYWSQFETPFWSTEIKRGGRTYSRLDLALRHFLTTKTGQLVDARRVNEEYRRWIATSPPRYTNVRQELADLARVSSQYRYYEELPAEALPCTDLRRILLDFNVSTALPLVLFLELEAGLDTERLSGCLALIEAFIARRALLGEEVREHNKLFVEVVGALRGKGATETRPTLLRKLLSGVGSTRKWPTDAEVIECAISRPLFAEMRAAPLRLVLERLEVSSRSAKSEVAEAPTGLQIEHVMPQSWARHWTLQGVAIPDELVKSPYLAVGEFAPLAGAIRERNTRLNTLGNLTLLNKHLNPAASNAAFATKRGEYASSVLRLNRYFDQLEVWHEDAIQVRGQMLGEMLCRIWPRPDA